MSAKDDERVISIRRETPKIFQREDAGKSLMEGIFRKEAQPTGISEQGVATGVKGHPFDMKAAISLVTGNVHHSRCIRAKRNATVGLGHISDKVKKTLNPLCKKNNWQSTLNRLGDDYWLAANAYLEVIRDGDTITGLHHIPAASVFVVVENADYDMHYLVRASSGEGFGDVTFAEFGGLDSFRKPGRQGSTTFNAITQIGNERPRIAELIPIQQESPLSRWYGMPDWAAATPSIELVQCHVQHHFDFFNNHGVPDYILFVLGEKIAKEDWAQLKAGLQAQVGLGNAHKNIIANLAGGEHLKVQLEKLAAEGMIDGAAFESIQSALELAIVSAHGVPPLLAGIQIPGRLGATNELPSALACFQTLVIAQAQADFTEALEATLGNPDLNGGLGLGPGDFDFNTIIDEIDLTSLGGQGTPGVNAPMDPNAPASNNTNGADGLKALDTMTRMRQSPMQAMATGRDLGNGVKK